MLHDPNITAAPPSALDEEEVRLLRGCRPEQCDALKARDAAQAADLYETRHGPAKAHGARASNVKQGKGNAAVNLTAAFTVLAAKEASASVESVRRWIRRGRGIEPSVLDEVAKLPRHGQGRILDALLVTARNDQAARLQSLLNPQRQPPTGERFRRGNLVLRNEDCADVMERHIRAGRTFDVLASDPPYGVQWKAAGHGPIANDEAPPLWVVPLWKKLLGVGGKLVFFTGEKVWFRWERALREHGFAVRRIVAWDKQSKFFDNRPTELLIFADLNPMPSHIVHRTWSFPVIRDKAHRDDSPTPKPVEMMVEMLRCAGGGSVFDAFVGGTAPIALAARQLGLRYEGAEIDPGYFAKAKAWVA